MGILKVKGRIDLKQFWPPGKSDADTTKIIVDVTGQQFLYKANNSAKFRPTNVFKDAHIRATGKTRPHVFKRGKWITIRLQGIDAPELHYKIYGALKTNGYSAEQKTALKKYNAPEYRQYQAETATVALASMMGADKGIQDVECEFITDNIDKPSDVCDLYGRFVGNVRVKSNGKKEDINHWLLREGYVFPSFYTSMKQAEVKKAMAQWDRGKRNTRILRYYSQRILDFDSSLRFREKGKVNPAKDRGKLILPKLFRRHCVFWIYAQSKIRQDSFIDYLTSKSGEDRWVPIASLRKYQALKTDAEKRRFSTPLVLLVQDNVFSKGPEKVAFTEKDAFLYNSAGKEISRWW